MSALLIASPAEAQPVCFSNPDCPAASVCNWGLCESAIGMFSTVVVQVSVADVADVSGVAGTEGMRAYLADELARALNETGVVHALRERGNAFSLREVLARAGAKGSAYVVFATMVAFDGVRASVKVETWGVETEAREEGLSARLEVSAGRVVHECDRLANRAALHFSGRPGILGTRIAVVRKLGPGVKELFMLTYGSNELVQLTSDRSLVMLPAWTADGRVAYTSYREGEPKTFLQDRKEPFAAYGGMNSGIAWSKDGAVAAITLSLDGNPELYLLEGTTGEIRSRLTFWPGIDTSPTWSPDGTKIMFVSDRDSTPQLFLMNADGSDKQRVTGSGVYNSSPDWHPFGPFVAYTGQVGVRFQVFLLSLEDGSQRQLTDGPGDCEDPAWSPDGRLIAFVWEQGKTRDLWVMRPDGSSMTQLTHDGLYYTPAWEPAAY